MSRLIRKNIIKLFSYAKLTGSGLSNKILASYEGYADVHNSDDEVLIDLIRMIGLVNPDYVKPDLDIGSAFVDGLED